MAHCHRSFFDFWQATKTPVAKKALDRIAAGSSAANGTDVWRIR
jgi:hypothetical protein